MRGRRKVSPASEPSIRSQARAAPGGREAGVRSPAPAGITGRLSAAGAPGTRADPASTPLPVPAETGSATRADPVSLTAPVPVESDCDT
ncbi:hypothetical protein Plo01_00690 [Planobispora longispora]|uniref:Uncharacterized protein n=1 Tax=Planobispora longispora TaxID=28887 RepID=A0A8J3W2U8_9ACTN|nr:hypothetical protein Plo01_00690 [Planobispora longispora]